MANTSHLIFGAGLIGSYLLGCFTKNKVNIQLVERPSAHQAFQNGIHIRDYLGNQYSSSETIDFVSAHDKDSFDVIWLTVKCTSIDHQTMDSLRAFVGESSTIICCQNGFGSDDIIKQAFPKNTVLNAVVGFNVAQTDNGHWLRSTQGTLVIENHDAIANINNDLASELLPIKLSDNIEGERWAKLQLNLANAINALADIPIKEMTENAGYRRVIAALMDELLLVTHTLAIELPKVSAVHGKLIPRVLRFPNFLFKLVAQKMLAIDPLARTSMWHDLNQQRSTEINFINGAVSYYAKKSGLKSPANDAVINLIKAIEVEQKNKSNPKITGLSAEQLCAELGL